MANRRVALVTVWFPPNNGVAVNRMQAFAQYLGEHGPVEVFTQGPERKVEDTGFGRVYYLPSHPVWDRLKHKSTDSRFLHLCKTVSKVILTKLGASAYRSWKREAARALENRHKEAPFSVVISSYSPVEAHDAAFEIVKKNRDLKWITDMRDEMGSNPFLPAASKHKLRERELAYLPYVTALTTIADPILDDFKKVMPGLQGYAEVRNGFDHDVQPVQNFNGRFTVVYAGTFYGKRKPDHLFEAVERLLSAGLVGNDICFRFIGTNHNFFIPAALTAYVEFVPQVAYRESVEMMAKADCNLLVNPPMGTKGQYSGKIFDYVSVEKPILALVDLEDVAAALIREHNAGIAVDFNDTEGIARAFRELYDGWKRKELFPVDRSRTGELHRKYQVEKLWQLIEQIDPR